MSPPIRAREHGHQGSPKVDLMTKPDDTALVLFDGVCNLCHGAVRFIIARDPAKHFRFASLQSPTGLSVIREHDLPEDVRSMILVEPDGRVYARSTAALRVARRLGALWPLLAVLEWVPAFLRDPFYEWVARNRYRWFGRKDSCPLPDPALADRFIG
jgi:predicted DCC family thiol-disulfide oxidoreductase YuxK